MLQATTSSLESGVLASKVVLPRTSNYLAKSGTMSGTVDPPTGIDALSSTKKHEDVYK